MRGVARNGRRIEPPLRGTLVCFSDGRSSILFLRAQTEAIVDSRRDAIRVTSGCPGQIVQGHASLRDAHIAFANDLHKGLVRQVPYYGHDILPLPIPTPQGLPSPPESEMTTYVVTQGRRVGVFSDW